MPAALLLLAFAPGFLFTKTLPFFPISTVTPLPFFSFFKADDFEAEAGEAGEG